MPNTTLMGFDVDENMIPDAFFLLIFSNNLFLRSLAPPWLLSRTNKKQQCTILPSTWNESYMK